MKWGLVCLLLLGCTTYYNAEQARQDFWSRCSPGEVTVGNIRADLVAYSQGYFTDRSFASVRFFVIGIEEDSCHVQGNAVATGVEGQTSFVFDMWINRYGEIIRTHPRGPGIPPPAQ